MASEPKMPDWTATITRPSGARFVDLHEIEAHHAAWQAYAAGIRAERDALRTIVRAVSADEYGAALLLKIARRQLSNVREIIETALENPNE